MEQDRKKPNEFLILPLKSKHDDYRVLDAPVESARPLPHGVLACFNVSQQSLGICFSE